MKKVVSMIPVIAMVISVLTIVRVSAEVFEGDGWSFESETGTLTLSANEGTTAWRDNEVDFDDVLTVIIEDTVTSIGGDAFLSCNSLVSVVIPDSVTSIEEYAFAACEKLENITIGSGVKEIHTMAFTRSGSLKAIDVDAENLYYSSHNGDLYNKDKSVICYYSVGKNDSSFTFPESVKAIGNHAFYFCRTLTSLEIPDKITDIGRAAFAYCDKLEYVNVGSGVQKIEALAFISCLSLTSINVSEENLYYSSYNGDLYNKDKTLLLQCLTGRSEDSFTVPESVITIGDYAFYDCSELENVDIGSGVEDIGESAFSNCVSLTEIEIPDSVLTIGLKAFQFCIKLESVIIGNGVLIIGEQAFHGCNSLTEIEISDSVIVIGDWAFSETSLVNVIIPDGVEIIKFGAFMSCPELKEITIGNGVKTIEEATFYGCTSLTSISVGENNSHYSSYNGDLYNKDKTVLCQYATGKSDNIFIIPDGVTMIERWAFSLSSLYSVIIPADVKTIELGAFARCSELKEVYIKNGLETMEMMAFSDCTSLETVIFEQTSPPELGDYAFWNTPKLTAIYVPMSATESYKNAENFADYSDLIKGICTVCEKIPCECAVNSLYIGEVNITDGCIELCNPTGNAFSCKGLFLSDSDEDPFKWQIPSVIIRAGGAVWVKIEGNNSDALLKRIQINFDLNIGDSLRLVMANDEFIKNNAL